MRLFPNATIVILSGILLSGCVGAGYDREAPQPVRPTERAVADGQPRVGTPYTIAGRTYTPVDQIDYDEVGYASWYGSELEGQPTANGEPFRASWVSAAHRTLPLPAYVEVTRLDTGATILVRINDRGPADPNRLIDLSAGAAEQLGFAEAGMIQVRVRRVNPHETERLALRSGGQVLPRQGTPDSLLEILRERAGRLPRPAGYGAPRAIALPPRTDESESSPSPRSPAAAGGFVVQVGAFTSRERAEALARRLGARVVAAGGVFRVRYGPFATEAEAQAAVNHARELGQPGAVIQRQP